jgi:hypothetical protein
MVNRDQLKFSQSRGSDHQLRNIFGWPKKNEIPSKECYGSRSRFHIERDEGPPQRSKAMEEQEANDTRSCTLDARANDGEHSQQEPNLDLELIRG